MSMTRRKIMSNALGMAFAALTSTVFTLPAMAQSATQSLSSESVIETIKQEGVIRIGLSIFTPWSMRDVNGELIGFELDVGRALAEDMGVEVEFVPTAWDGIIPQLMSLTVDLRPFLFSCIDVAICSYTS